MFKKNKSKEKIQALEEEIKKLKSRDLDIGFFLEENVPKSENEYKRYIADIALFYGSVFRDKLKHFIGLQMEFLSQVGRSEIDNTFIKANINAFRLIDKWMEEKTNEHFGILEEMRKKYDNESDFISNFKNTYGEN